MAEQSLGHDCKRKMHFQMIVVFRCAVCCRDACKLLKLVYLQLPQLLYRLSGCTEVDPSYEVQCHQPRVRICKQLLFDTGLDPMFWYG